jgi:hypothetical protein
MTKNNAVRILFVIIIAAAAYFFLIKLPGENSDQKQSTNAEFENSDYVQAEEGGVVPGLPESLELNGMTEIKQSYAVQNESQSVARTVLFSSSQSPDVNYDFYLEWAEKNGWELTQYSGKDLEVLNLDFIKGREELSIGINSNFVTIVHTKKP